MAPPSSERGQHKLDTMGYLKTKTETEDVVLGGDGGVGGRGMNLGGVKRSGGWI